MLRGVGGGIERVGEEEDVRKTKRVKKKKIRPRGD